MNIQTHEIYQPEIVRKRIAAIGQKPIQLASPVKGAIRGNFTKACKLVANSTDEGGGDNPRYIRLLVWSYLATPETDTFTAAESSKRFSDATLYAFGRWQTERLPTGIYRQRSAFPSELRWVLYRARHDLKCQQEKPLLTLGDLLKIWKDESPFGDGDDGIPITSMMDFARDMVDNPPDFQRVPDIQPIPEGEHCAEIVDI